MANSAVQTSSVGSGTGSSVATTLSATVQGNLVVVHIRLSDNTETCSSVTDDKGNAYVLSAAVTNSNRTYQAYGVQVTGGVTTVTANFSASTATKKVGADEYSLGVAATSNAQVADTLSTNSGSGTSLSTGTFTPASNGELCVATFGTPSQNFSTPGSYTFFQGVDPCQLKSEYLLSGTTSENPGAIGSFGGSWTAIGQSFISPSPAATSGNPVRINSKLIVKFSSTVAVIK